VPARHPPEFRQRAVEFARLGCCPALKMSITAAFGVSMFGDERPRRAGAGRGRGVQGVGVMLTLS
jgi:hypothetical protein